MSRPATPIVVSLTIKRRQFRILIREQGPFAWVATIGRPTGRPASTGSLGTATVATSPEAALRRAIDEIILMVVPLGAEPEEPQEAPQEGRPTEVPPTSSPVPAASMPWRRLNR